MGKTIDILQHTITGQGSVLPFNPVSFRILQRMGDILMNKPEKDVLNPFANSEADIIETLKEEYRQIYKDRKQSEREYWEDCPDNFLAKLEKN